MKGNLKNLQIAFSLRKDEHGSPELCSEGFTSFFLKYVEEVVIYKVGNYDR